MTGLTLLTAICLMASLVADRSKTLEGIRKGSVMFVKLLPVILSVIILISVLMYFVPPSLIVEHLGEDAGSAAWLIAAIAGAVALIPGFIAYPLAGILVQNGVSYQIIAVFITTLMMVGIVTLPIESRFFGLKTALLRNVLFFIGSLIIGLIVGLAYAI